MMPKTKLGRLRAMSLDISAVEFARLAQDRGCETLTPSRLRKIESGELIARAGERKAIADLLGIERYEVSA